MKLIITINNQKKTFEVPPNRTLIDLLRSQGFWSVKRGCETGDCGNCTVILDGKAVYSCIMLAVQADGKSIETLENIFERKEYQYLIQVIMDFGDIECGYCNSGMIMSLKALLDTDPEPEEEKVIDALAGNVCRCFNDFPPVDAIMEAIRKMRGEFS